MPVLQKNTTKACSTTGSLAQTDGVNMQYVKQYSYRLVIIHKLEFVVLWVALGYENGACFMDMKAPSLLLRGHVPSKP